MSQGKFIVLEGGEGVGKTTQADLLVKKLQEVGRTATFIREPGGDEAAEKIRELLLDPSIHLEYEAEVLLFNAARTQTLAKVKALLDDGTDVVSDRSSLSTVVYQGYARGVNIEDVRSVCAFATHAAKPDLVLLLDAPLQKLSSRRQERGVNDRFEELGDDFHQKVRDGYIAEANLLNYPVVDASPSVNEVFEQIWQKVQPLIN